MRSVHHTRHLSLDPALPAARSSPTILFTTIHYPPFHPHPSTAIHHHRHHHRHHHLTTTTIVAVAIANASFSSPSSRHLPRRAPSFESPVLAPPPEVAAPRTANHSASLRARPTPKLVSVVATACSCCYSPTLLRQHPGAQRHAVHLHPRRSPLTARPHTPRNLRSSPRQQSRCRTCKLLNSSSSSRWLRWA